MTADSTGYDLHTSIFSPEGRIYQVEYAAKAVSRSGTAIGMRGRDGVVLAAENFMASPLYEMDGSSRIFSIDQHIGAVVAGFLPDARAIVNQARTEANAYRTLYHSQAPLTHIKKNVGSYVNTYTQFGVLRPFGASVILGAYMPDGPELYCVQPSGTVLGYFGCAIGKAADDARSEMEEIDIEDQPIVELVKEAARIIYAIHDDETDFRLELSWCGKRTGGRHVTVPPRVHQGAENYAKEIMEEKANSD